MEIVSEACREERIGWPERLGVAVASTLRFLAVEPATAHLLGTEPPAGEPASRTPARQAIGRLAELLASGRGLRPEDAAELPPAHRAPSRRRRRGDLLGMGRRRGRRPSPRALPRADRDAGVAVRGLAVYLQQG